MADAWPLQDFLKFGALPAAAGCARWHAKNVLWEWGLTSFSEPVELIVTELMTNAIKASQALEGVPPVRLWLLSDRQRVLVLIWDANPKPPMRMEVSEDAESGRGLVLVDAVSDKWDWYFHQGMGGKIVWSLVTQDDNQLPTTTVE
jgi:anti-sigma regulatory factor (Ser/Thr protein kinase)